MTDDEGMVHVFMARLSYAHVFEPYYGPDGNQEGAYACVFLLPKSRTADETYEVGGRRFTIPSTAKQVATIQRVIQEVRVKKWRDKQPPLGPHLLCLRDGDVDQKYPEHWYLSSRCPKTNKPEVRMPDRSPASPGDVYSGCWADGIVQIWAQGNIHGKRVNATLKGVMKKRDDDAFGGVGRKLTAADWDDMAPPDDWDVGSGADDDVRALLG